MNDGTNFGWLYKYNKEGFTDYQQRRRDEAVRRYSSPLGPALIGQGSEIERASRARKAKLDSGTAVTGRAWCPICEQEYETDAIGKWCGLCLAEGRGRWDVVSLPEGREPGTALPEVRRVSRV